MRRTPLDRRGMGPPACLALLLLPLVAAADPPKGQKITFESFDKVELAGTFFPSNQDGTKSRCALLLHRYSGSRDEEGCDVLVKALQEKGFAVLTFDFRGHGDSTTVKPAFWGLQTNQRGMRNVKPGKETISYKDFRPEYVPMLVNDIAAAKYTLEQKNNAKECNVANVVVVGAEEGATLGLLWVASEATRRRQVITPMGTLAPNPETEIKDLDAVVCLSLRGAIDKRAMPLPTWVNAVPKFRDKLPICLFYGKDDVEGERTAKHLFDDTLRLKSTKEGISNKIDIAGTKLGGQKLIASADLKVDEMVGKYLDKVTDKKSAQVWSERETKFNPLTAPVPLGHLGVTLP